MADRERRIAEILYDELTGKQDGVPFELREYGENAALAMVVASTPEIRQLLLDADHLGYELHPWCGNRWTLACRLARLIVADEPRSSGADAARPRL